MGFDLMPSRPISQLIIYQTEDRQTRLDVWLEDETVRLSQQLMAELFQTSQQNISQNISSIYREDELLVEATHKKFLSVRQEGKRQVRRELDHYNLDMVISVGYRVNSKGATQFRQWATQVLREFDEREILQDAGEITAKIAKEFSESAFEKYRLVQDRLFKPGFDKFLGQQQKEKSSDSGPRK